MYFTYKYCAFLCNCVFGSSSSKDFPLLASRIQNIRFACRSVDSLVNMLPCVLELQEQLKRAVQDRDMETSHGICRVVVALGETHCRLG